MVSAAAVSFFHLRVRGADLLFFRGVSGKGKNMETTKQNDFLEREKPGKLMARYAVPCIISLLVAALYNIVDQIFIANAPYLGSYGNSANTVVYPLTVVALAFAVLIGDGCCAYVSISLGAGRGVHAVGVKALVEHQPLKRASRTR